MLMAVSTWFGRGELDFSGHLILGQTYLTLTLGKITLARFGHGGGLDGAITEL